MMMLIWLRTPSFRNKHFNDQTAMQKKTIQKVLCERVGEEGKERDEVWCSQGGSTIVVGVTFENIQAIFRRT